MSGIYIIRNLINNKVYVGLSKNMHNRLLFHKRRLVSNSHKNKHLQSSFNKYGLECFSFEMIEECCKNILPSREVYWIGALKSHNRNYGYNKTYGGEFGRLSDEIYAKYSERLKGVPVSEERKLIISKALTGRKRPKEEIEKAAKSCRKFGDKDEQEMMDLFNYGFSLKNIALMYNAKLTTIQSIRRRFRNGRK